MVNHFYPVLFESNADAAERERAEFLADYGLFLLKTATIVAAVVLIIGAAVAAGNRGSKTEQGHIEVRKLNERYDDMAQALKEIVLDPAAWPVLWHCSAGKDRAGWAATAVLLGLDVADELGLEPSPELDRLEHQAVACRAGQEGKPLAVRPCLVPGAVVRRERVAALTAGHVEVALVLGPRRDAESL